MAEQISAPVIEPKPRSRLRRFWEHPVASGGAWIATIAAIPLAVYLYAVPQRHRDLSYLVHPAKAIVVKTGQLSRLTVNLDGRPVTTDVTAAQLAFWNEGNEPIRSEHVLQPLVIRVGAPIVDVSVRKVSREVVHLTLDRKRASLGELLVSWNILEKGDGGSIQIIFSGGPETSIAASAVVEDQPHISRLDASDDRTQKYQGKRFGIRDLLPFLPFATLSPLVFVLPFIRARKKPTPKEVAQITAVFLCTTIVVFGLVWMFRPAAPPFGF